MKKCTKCDCNYECYGQRCSLCKPCKRRYDREYHKNRPQEKKDKKNRIQRERINKISLKLRLWKKELGCSFCEESDPVCLDLHHLDLTKKEMALSEAIRHGWTWKRLMAEADKCIVVCSNCHRKLHAHHKHNIS